jgi:hypothetical protein
MLCFALLSSARPPQVEEPIALEGTVCASSDYDTRKGRCVASSQASAVAQPEGAGKQLVAEGGVAAAGAGAKGHEHGEEERGECPLCTYMMNSPCKDVFVVFKACIDKCVPWVAVVGGCWFVVVVWGGDRGSTTLHLAYSPFAPCAQIGNGLCVDIQHAC